MKFSDKQKHYFVTFCKVRNIIDRHSGYAHIIPRTADINAAAVMGIFEKHIKPTIGLRCSIVSDQDVLFISPEFLDCVMKNGIRHKVYATDYAEIDG